MTSRLQSFETNWLTRDENLPRLAAINRALMAKAETIGSSQCVVLDMDSTEIPVYGQQGQSAYNGHFECTCYHPLLLFNREGDCLAAKLRPGNVHSAEGWEAGKTCPRLLAFLGGEPSDPGAVRGDAAADRVAALASGVEPAAGGQKTGEASGRDGEVSEKAHRSQIKLPVDSIPDVHTWLRDPALGSGVQNCFCKRASGGRSIRAEDAKTEILGQNGSLRLTVDLP